MGRETPGRTRQGKRWVIATLVVVLATVGLAAWVLVPRQSFEYAVNTGDVEDVARWLRFAPQLATTKFDPGHHGGFWPLDGATLGDRPEIVRMLLDAGADPAPADWAPRTMLHNAAGYAPPETIRLLLDAGLDAAQRDDDGRTALHEAANPKSVRSFAQLESDDDQSRAIEVSRILLDRGCPVDPRDKWGMTPFHVALRRNALDVARFLLDHGADPNARPDDWMTSEPSQALFRDQSEEDLARLRRPTPLHVLIYLESSIEVVSWLIANGADLHAIAEFLEANDELGQERWIAVTPIELAIRIAQPDTIETLLAADDHVGDLSKTLADHPDLLWRAIAAERVELVRRLLDAGADPNAGDGRINAVGEANEIDDPAIRRRILDLLQSHGARGVE